MTLATTYATLKTALDDWTHNGGSLDSKWAEIIAMAEARMYDELILRDMESEEDLTLTQDQNYVAIPSGFISPIALWLIVDTQRVLLEMVLPQDLPYHTESSIPRYWAIDGSNIRFDVPAAEAYSAKFRMLKTSNLSDSSPTNSLLTKRPDVYMAACLSEYSRYASDQEAFNMWEPKYLKASAALKAAENRSRTVALRTDLPCVGRGASILTGD
jgi:hypothetical protein